MFYSSGESKFSYFASSLRKLLWIESMCYYCLRNNFDIFLAISVITGSFLLIVIVFVIIIIVYDDNEKISLVNNPL